MRITQCRLKGRVTEIHLNFLQGIALVQQQRCACFTFIGIFLEVGLKPLCNGSFRQLPMLPF